MSTLSRDLSIDSRPPEPRSIRAWLRANAVNAILSALVIGAVLYGLARFFDWAVLRANWHAQSAEECRETAGACWAVLRERGRLVLFGLYPFEEQWRPLIACAVLIGAAVTSCISRFQTARALIVVWVVSFIVFTVLMGGGVFGLEAVPQSKWGGLALTFYIFAAMMIIGMPLSYLFAVARVWGPEWAVVLVSIVVDFVRSIPLTVVLFFVALVLPGLIPAWLAGDKLYRVIGGFALFFACYQSEILRGAMQALSAGQVEACKALGMRFWQTQLTVVMPQVFRTAMPQTVNQVVSAFKDTSYVAIVGSFDMTASASAALGTGQWAAAFVEVYLAVGFVYLIFGYALSRYGHYLEVQADKAYRR